MGDAAVSALGSIEGHRAVFVVLDSRFLMGSMGTAVGGKGYARDPAGRAPQTSLIIFAASGGARMQEGIFSLMQMAKTAAAIDRFQKRGGLYISCLTHPTTGGVTASFASLGDIMLAEPGALIGFAGPRVIEQTIGEKLPEGFQSAEALLQNGFLDQIVPRDRWRAVLSQVLLLHEGKKEAQRCERKNRKEEKSLPEMQEKLTPWQQVVLARDAGRPGVVDYIAHLFTDFLSSGVTAAAARIARSWAALPGFTGFRLPCWAIAREKIWMKISPAVSACLPRKVIGKRSV